MTFLQKRWWIYVCVFVVTLTAMGCSSEEDGTMDYTRDEVVDILVNAIAPEIAFGCRPSAKGDGYFANSDEFMTSCFSGGTSGGAGDFPSAFTVWIIEKHNKVNRLKYNASYGKLQRDRDVDIVETESVSHRLIDTICVLIDVGSMDECEWFENAFKDAKRVGKEASTVINGTYITVRHNDVENGFSYWVDMDARFNNEDINKQQESYSCERLSEEAIRMSEENEDAITMLKIYNLKHNIEYDIDMHIKVGMHMNETEGPYTMRISECIGQARLDRGGERSITVYADADRDGEVFVGYSLTR